ncbi:hypothetical protein BGZ61DRAFT_15892 [Ilyonectria robusta]|uniref:uncharacterized protein n=1 Tax=Ilyonectria robusta TaxID=1079257 RepID=UPI001E8D9C51|nr:uncharacterized protein BGZ61DRAFT_15892 [Ilyonectria robusta]KAH8737429.1 hypothetical protein BGZ61DRAFT_15892 [Ilyonectria robusta]
MIPQSSTDTQFNRHALLFAASMIISPSVTACIQLWTSSEQWPDDSYTVFASWNLQLFPFFEIIPTTSISGRLVEVLATAMLPFSPPKAALGYRFLHLHLAPKPSRRVNRS